MKTLYHYTRLENAKKIIESKKIKRTKLNVPKDEKPICWLSINEFHEISAYPQLSLQELIDMGYVRFTVKDAKFLKIDYWKVIVKKANMQPLIQHSLSTKTEANSSEWYGTLKDIPLALVENIEYMNENQRWTSVTKDELLQLEMKSCLKVA